jgi:hypothetical protein
MYRTFDRVTVLALVCVLVAFEKTLAFAPHALQESRRNNGDASASSSSHRTRANMVKFDGDKWMPESDQEGPEAGYGVARTFFRHGPTPAARRVFQPAEYEQAVLKFMANDKCSRDVAQGNMDYYLRNPNDWFAMRMQEEKSGYKFDYVSIDAQKIVLVTSKLETRSAGQNHRACIFSQ